MANIAKKELDTRTFPEICASLSQVEWLELKRRILTRLMKTEQTCTNWKNGKTYPATLAERKEVSSIVNSFLGTNTNHVTLFKLS